MAKRFRSGDKPRITDTSQKDSGLALPLVIVSQILSFMDIKQLIGSDSPVAINQTWFKASTITPLVVYPSSIKSAMKALIRFPGIREFHLTASTSAMCFLWKHLLRLRHLRIADFGDVMLSEPDEVDMLHQLLKNNPNLYKINILAPDVDLASKLVQFINPILLSRPNASLNDKSSGMCTYCPTPSMQFLYQCGNHECPFKGACFTCIHGKPYDERSIELQLMACEGACHKIFHPSGNPNGFGGHYCKGAYTCTKCDNPNPEMFYCDDCAPICSVCCIRACFRSCMLKCETCSVNNVCHECMEHNKSIATCRSCRMKAHETPLIPWTPPVSQCN